MGIIRLKAGIRRECDRKLPMCLGEGDAKHMLLKCPETKRREEVACSNGCIRMRTQQTRK
jgi:hypothetical protein